MKTHTKMNGRTLNQFLQELNENGCTEITRVMPLGINKYSVEYNTAQARAATPQEIQEHREEEFWAGNL